MKGNVGALNVSEGEVVLARSRIVLAAILSDAENDQAGSPAPAAEGPAPRGPEPKGR